VSNDCDTLLPSISVAKKKALENDVDDDDDEGKSCLCKEYEERNE